MIEIEWFQEIIGISEIIFLFIFPNSELDIFESPEGGKKRFFKRTF